MTAALPVPILTASEMRAAEHACMADGVSADTLMRRAGDAVAEAVRRYGGGQEVLILCGPGNNGGDGYVAARRLVEMGISVRVAAITAPQTAEAKAARDAWGASVDTLGAAAPAPILVDALFGTGLSRRIDASIGQDVHSLSQAARFVIAVDVPSGVSADDGGDLGAVCSSLTIALGALKPAHVIQPSASLCGHVRVADIGIRARSNVNLVTKPCLSAPLPTDHKYTRGLVTVMAGAMAGAASLAAGAAQRSGAGYVVVAGPSDRGDKHALVFRSVDDALNESRIGAVVVGPGLGRGADARALLDRLMDSDWPIVIDADGLRLIATSDFSRFMRRTAPVILTPHAGEFKALFGDVSGSKIEQARGAARLSGCHIIYKGSDTVIASNDGRVSVASAASPWLATAGTGDVLSGIVAAMMAQRLSPHNAACAAVWLHGEAARRAGPALIADDLLDHLGAAVARCL
jgi:ADP-dependent NAD(P)H-hydrate dehydratase / NAD(P)H-hydrate epimerase